MSPRAVRTVVVSWLAAASLLALVVPGTAARRSGAGLAASGSGLLVLAMGMAGADALLQAGYLGTATALGLLTLALVVEVPARVLGRLAGVEVEVARGAVAMAVFVTCFVAAGVAGPDPERRPG